VPVIAPATIAELARRSGVAIASIRLYEEMGLLPKPRRRRGRSGDPAYHQEHLDRLTFIKRAVALGFPLTTVAELTGVNGGLQTCNDIYQIVVRQLGDVRQRIEELTRAAGTLQALAESCPRRGPRADCTVIAALSRPSEC
jgi:DNA-binding transcriptional MerR regulator